MDKNRIKYKNYIINIRPWKAVDESGWVPEAEVEYHFGSGVTVTPLYSKKILSSEEEAVKHSIGMAKYWIDRNC